MINKKIILIVLPALLAISSCSGAKVKSNDQYAGVIEDTLMHDEIFGELPNLNNHRYTLSPRNALPGGTDLYKPVIGFQRKPNNDGTYSVRFVAAMQSGTDSAFWMRSVHNLSGSTVGGKAKKRFDVETVYTALNNNGNPSYASEQEAEDGTTPYDCYAVYCLLNVPASAADYYLTAYLTVNNSVSYTVSDVGSINVADSSKRMKFSLTAGDRYIAKVNDVVKESDPHDGNHLVLNSLVLDQYDTLQAYYIDTGNLTYTRYGYSDLGRSNPDFVEGANGEIVAKYPSTQNVFLNNDNDFYFQKKIYLQAPSWWTGNRQLEMNDTDNGNNSDPNKYKKQDMTYLQTLSSGEMQFYAFVDSSFYESVQFFRDNANYTGYKVIPTDGKNLYVRANTSNDGAHDGEGEWSTFVASEPVEDNSGFTINELTEPQEIHTELQKTYLSYAGDYSQMDPEDYPDGDQLLSDSLPVTVSWEYTPAKSLDHYSVVYGQNPDLSDGYEVSAGESKAKALVNPYLRRNYYKVIANFTDGTSEESAIHNFYVGSSYPRNLAIGGMTNCRDLGGRVLEDGGVMKQGLIYRTCGKKYDYSTTPTSAGETEMLQHLGFKTEINIADGTSYDLKLSGTTTLDLFMDYGGNTPQSNHHFSRNAESLKNFFEAVADENNYPIFFHCRIGTDRTGLCAIMLSGLLGVSLNEIYQDYLFSNFGNIQDKRYIGIAAGQDNIENYMNEINQMSGTTFKNKVYNTLLSIGVSRDTLDTVIANLTEGQTARNNYTGQVIARADVLTGGGVSVTEDNSERNNPDYYYTLDSESKYVSYEFTASEAYAGQVVAYLGNTNHSDSMYIDDALKISLDDREISVRHVDYATAGMGNCNGRINYYPVILASNVSISAGEHRIVLGGTSNTMNVGGIYIFDASLNTTNLGGGVDSGELHYHNYQAEILTPSTCSTQGTVRYTCSICGDQYEDDLPTTPHSYGSPVEIPASHTNAGYLRYTCTECGYVYDEKIADIIPHSWSVDEKDAETALRPMTCECGGTGYELQAADVTSGESSPDTSVKNSRLGKNHTDDVWNITGITAGTYDVYLQGCTQTGNQDAYWNAGTAQDHGGSASDNGNSRDYRYKIKVDNGDYVNVGNITDRYSDFGLTNLTVRWTNQSVARVTVSANAESITLHSLNNGYAIWVYGLRLVRV